MRWAIAVVTGTVAYPKGVSSAAPVNRRCYRAEPSRCALPAVEPREDRWAPTRAAPTTPPPSRRAHPAARFRANCGSRSSGAGRWAGGCWSSTGRPARSAHRTAGRPSCAAPSPPCSPRVRRSHCSSVRSTAPSTTTRTSPRWAAGIREISAGRRSRCGPRLGTCCRSCSTGCGTATSAFIATDHPFMIERHGFLEETYFDVSYDPIRSAAGAVTGIFCIVSDSTYRVLGERRVADAERARLAARRLAGRAVAGRPRCPRCSARTRPTCRSPG